MAVDPGEYLLRVAFWVIADLCCSGGDLWVVGVFIVEELREEGWS